MELIEVKRRAARAYRDEREQIAARRSATKARDRLRKLSPAGGGAALPADAAENWAWHRKNQAGFDRLPFDLQREDVLAITGPRGVDGYAALRAAGFVLLDWLAESGRPITATKFGSTTNADAREDGNAYAPSEAVAFLAHHFVELDPTLEAENPARPGSRLALDAAFRITRAYQAARSG